MNCMSDFQSSGNYKATSLSGRVPWSRPSHSLRCVLRVLLYRALIEEKEVYIDPSPWFFHATRQFFILVISQLFGIGSLKYGHQPRVRGILTPFYKTC